MLFLAPVVRPALNRDLAPGEAKLVALQFCVRRANVVPNGGPHLLEHGLKLRILDPRQHSSTGSVGFGLLKIRQDFVAPLGRHVSEKTFQRRHIEARHQPLCLAKRQSEINGGGYGPDWVWLGHRHQASTLKIATRRRNEEHEQKRWCLSRHISSHSLVAVGHSTTKRHKLQANVLGAHPVQRDAAAVAQISRHCLVVRWFERVVAGEFDHLPEQAFYMVGGIEGAIEKARKLKAGG